MGYPSGQSTGINFVLPLVIIFESALFFPFPKNIILSFPTVSLITLLQLNFRPQPISPMELFGTNTITLIIYLITITLLMVLLKQLLDLSKTRLKDIERLDSAILQLTSANLGYQNYASVIEEESIIKERNRVSREVHDTVGYAMTNLIMMMEAASDLAPKDDAQLQELLTQAKTQAQNSLTEVRSALRRLRTIEFQKEKGILSIQKLVGVFQQATKVTVTVDYGNMPFSLGTEIDYVIYRTIQEGLTNAFRHGKAPRVIIRFWCVDNELKIVIRDNGVGASEIKEGIGLVGMRERIGRLGGTITARTVFDGFELLASIPIAEDKPKEIPFGENVAG